MPRTPPHASLDELLGEAADQVELWSDRAHYWRAVAVEFSAGRRDAYSVPRLGGQRLRESAPQRLDWGPPEPTVHPLVADLAALRHWWVPKGERPLGRVEA